MMDVVAGSTGRIRDRAMKKKPAPISVVAALIVPILAPTILAEPQRTTGPAFLVASVKPNLSDGYMSADLYPGRFDARNLSVKDLVHIAYDVEFQRIVGGPAWIDSDRFDIAAVFDSDPGSEPEIGGRTGRPSASPADRSRFRPMLQRLLAERFRLRVSIERRALPHYALVVSRPETFNARVRPSVVDCDAQYEQRRREGLRRERPTGPYCGLQVVFGGGAATIISDAATMSDLAGYLRPEVGRLVDNQTNVDGRFQIEFTFASELATQFLGDGFAAPGGEAPLGGLSVFAALEEQLGLALESRTGPVEVLVIEHVERPNPELATAARKRLESPHDVVAHPGCVAGCRRAVVRRGRRGAQLLRPPARRTRGLRRRSRSRSGCDGHA